MNSKQLSRIYSGISTALLLAVLSTGIASPQTPSVALEKLQSKTILLFTPHPDDDTFCCAGTLALLAKQNNNIHIFIYTNDDKGSYDPDMSSQRLAQIRGMEEENACKIIGIPAANIHWLQFHDGMLEYANTLDLVEEVTKIIRTYRPDVVMSIDPGSEYVRWHKTDHRMAANNTIDGVRAAEWHLYFPNQLLHDHLKPWHVPVEVYYYVTPQDANYWVDVASMMDLKLQAATAHVSQFDPSITKYRPDWNQADLNREKEALRKQATVKDGRIVEAFRISGGFNQQ
jgi:LmbE family N-acetylglucosaminyl deacetylase